MSNRGTPRPNTMSSTANTPQRAANTASPQVDGPVGKKDKAHDNAASKASASATSATAGAATTGTTAASDASNRNRSKYRIEIQQMMFVSGETNDPPEATTALIEDIVKDQVIEIVLESSKSAMARGTRSISTEDVIFISRHDRGKVERLRTYLSWKDVRKNAKDQENGDIGNGNDLMDDSTTGGKTAGKNGPAVSGLGAESKMLMSKQKKSHIRLPWELEFMFSEQPLDFGENDEIDEEERDAVLAQMKRLKANDDRTKNMTQKEYAHWSDCRQASFTFRKAKRFREWCGMSHLTEARPNDDVIDILGFLTFEMVCTITEEALKVKQSQVDKTLKSNSTTNRKERKRKYLFDEPDDNTKPIMPEHVIEAWRLLQDKGKGRKALYNFRGGKFKISSKLF